MQPRYLERLQSFMLNFVGDKTLCIEALDKTFATVATDLETGSEVWFTKGSLAEAVWASISLPGIFPPRALSGALVGGWWIGQSGAGIVVSCYGS